mgnify:CR=1 FL=1
MARWGRERGERREVLIRGRERARSGREGGEERGRRGERVRGEGERKREREGEKKKTK